MASSNKFPVRTQLLMLVALIAFARLWCVTHPKEPEVQPREPLPVELVPAPTKPPAPQ